MQFLRKSTPTTVKIGPFLLPADGDTEVTGLTLGQADIRLSKNGSAYAQTNNVAGGTHDERGNYGIPLNTADLDTEGRLNVYIHVAGALPVWDIFTVLPTTVFDSLIAGSDTLQADMIQVNGAAISLASLNDISVADIKAMQIDGTEDLGEVLLALRASNIGKVVVADPTADPIVLNFYNKAGDTIIYTHTVAADGTGRTE